ncbi:MAG: 4Fe-4S dicluster domain-containing protein [Candidatus Marinimicrobia bacterium]|nr:4Fe-4S dicluster domain-containing protein [Candidatus Neomarinimicrobiota bacterium]
MTKNKTVSAHQISHENVDKLKDISGVNVYACYQCGNCSSACPAVEFMDIPPHQIIRKVQLGFIDELLESETPWICAACITCTVKCPRGVDIAKVMEALRQLVLRSDFEHGNLCEIEDKLRKKLPQIALIGNFRKTIL